MATITNKTKVKDNYDDAYSSGYEGASAQPTLTYGSGAREVLQGGYNSSLTSPSSTLTGSQKNKISQDPATEFAVSQPLVDLYNPYTGDRNVDYTQGGKSYSDFSNITPKADGSSGGGSGSGGGSAAPAEMPVYNSQYQDQISGILQSILNNNGNYNTPGEYQSKYSDQINAALQRVIDDNNNPYKLPEWNEQFSYDPYTNKYERNINDLVDQITNRQFSYDYKNDPLYQQLEQSYTRSGQRAMQDTLGQMAARTGGLASSYAGSAAQGAYNNYMAGLADKIPELQQLAYSMYRDQGNDLRNNLAMYQGLEGTDYDRWKNGYSMASNEYDRRYNQFSDDWNRQYTTQRDQRNDNKDILNTLQGLDNGDYGRWQDQYNNAMNAYNQQNDDNYRLLNLLQGMDQDEYNRWKAQVGIK